MAASASASASAAAAIPMRISSVQLRPGGEQQLRVVTLPKGTLLFRAIRLRSPSEDPNGMDLFQDFLGYPIGSSFCLSPIHNVYTFPIPYVGFGLYDWTSKAEAWRKYNAIMVYALTQDTRIITLILPAKEVRGSPKGWTRPGDILSRCDRFPPTECYRGLPNAEIKTKAFQEAQGWDNCLDPVRRQEEGLGGWIAVAEGDSIDVRRGKGRVRPRETPMGAYLVSMGAGDLIDTLPHMTIDARGTRGFPEIVVNPRTWNAGLTDTLVRPTASFENSLGMVADDLRNGRLAIAPIATITAAGFYFFDGTDIGFRREGVSASSIANMRPEDRRRRIEQNSYELMTRLGRGEVDGLPATTFDRRTGFFVMGGAGLDGRMGLRTGADWDAMRQYCVHVKGGVAGSEYLFQRPPRISDIVRDLELPYEGNSGIARAVRDLVGMEGRFRGGNTAVATNGDIRILSGNIVDSGKNFTAKNYNKLVKNKRIMNKNTRKNMGKNIGKNIGLPNPEIISVETVVNLENLYSELGAIVKNIFV